MVRPFSVRLNRSPFQIIGKIFFAHELVNLFKTIELNFSSRIGGNGREYHFEYIIDTPVKAVDVGVLASVGEVLPEHGQDVEDDACIGVRHPDGAAVHYYAPTELPPGLFIEKGHHVEDVLFEKGLLLLGQLCVELGLEKEDESPLLVMSIVGHDPVFPKLRGVVVQTKSVNIKRFPPPIDFLHLLETLFHSLVQKVDEPFHVKVIFRDPLHVTLFILIPIFIKLANKHLPQFIHILGKIIP